MKNIIRVLLLSVAVIAIFTCCKPVKEEKENDRNESVERQWLGSIVEDGKKINVCVDVGMTVPDKLVLGMNPGQYGLIFPGTGKNDYIYTDDMVMTYQVTFSSQDSGVIAVTASDGEVQEIPFMNLTDKSVTIANENETVTLTAGKVKLVRIDTGIDAGMMRF